MKIQTSKHQLNNATSGIQTSLADKSLAWLGMRTDSGKQLLLTAADWLMSIYHRIDCEVAVDGQAFVPARLFANVVRELPEGTIQLEVDTKSLLVTAGATNEFYFKLPLIEDVTWPEPFALQGETRMNFNAVELAYIIEQVLPSVAAESPRPYAAVGCLHKIETGCLRLVGTDSIRLSYSEMRLEDDCQQFPDNICLSRRALSELVRVCGDGGETTALYVIKDNTILVAESSQRQVFIRLAAVDYPRYMGALPEMATQLVSKAECSALQTVIRRVLLATDSTRVVRMQFSKNRLLLNANSSSECQEVLPLDNSLDASYKIDMNGKFILDILATVVSDNVLISFQDSDSPLTIVPEIELPGCSSRHTIPPIQEER